MGIPSYYRRLIGSVGGLLYKAKPGTLVANRAKELLMDYNCLIYHVLRDPKRAQWPSVDQEQDQWLERLYDDIIRYTMRVIRGAGAERVFIAVDGVVPMAKIRQQRMRRFRSAADAAKRAGAIGPIGQFDTSVANMQALDKAIGPVGQFDTNAITPGTKFMEGLRIRLEEMIRDERKEKVWVLSSADEPGEGEHKILSKLRENSSGEAPYVVYGLDGDLIVLLLWTQQLGITGTAPIWLYREDIEGGEVQVGDGGEEKYVWFSIDRLRDYLRDSEGVHIGDYCATMMLLGNDFLPTSLTFKIKDGGHNFLLGWLKTALQRGERFLTEDNTLLMGAWRRLFTQLAAVEERRFLETIQKKWRAVPRNVEEELPLQIREEKIFLKNGDASADALKLRENWRDVYAHTAFYATPGAEFAGVRCAINAYYTSMAWIVDYYVGRPVSAEWSYSWLLPPLWGDIAAVTINPVAPPVSPIVLRPQEQLALVLPAASWYLIPREDPVKNFISAAPEFFPTHFEYESIGRRFTWEMEAKIPIPSIQQLRAVI